MTRLKSAPPRLTIFIGENDSWHHRALFTEIDRGHRGAGEGPPAAARRSGGESLVILDEVEVSRYVSS